MKKTIITSFAGMLLMAVLSGSAFAAGFTYSSGTINMPIFDLSTTEASLPVPDTVWIQDMDVTINVNHTYDNDLSIYLVSPAGTTITLVANRGGSGDNFTNTAFSDEAATPIALGSPPFTGSFRPEGPLSTFDSTNASGTWKLRIVDSAGGDSGTLISWSLTITPAPHAVVSIAASGSNPTNAATVDWTVTFAGKTAGLSASNFSLVSTGLGGTPAITNVTGSGNTWTVTASTGTGDGTLQLSLTNDTGLNPAITNLPFAGGTYIIDKTPPDTSIASGPSNPSSSANATFSFSGSDPGGSGISGFECSMDGTPFAACASPKDYAGLNFESHIFEVRAIDRVGNMDLSPASWTWQGKASTTTSITSAPASASGIPVTVNYSVSSSAAGVPTGTVTISDGAVMCTGTVAAGSCTITFYAVGVTTLMATYSGDSSFQGSISGGTSHTNNAVLSASSIVIDPATPTTLYAGLDGAGIFKSTNSGTNWDPANTQPSNNRVKSIVIKPGDSTKLFAGTYGGGVYYSINSGVDWTVCTAQPGNQNVVSLTIDASGKLYAGTEAGVFVSSDGLCATWSPMNAGLP